MMRSKPICFVLNSASVSLSVCLSVCDIQVYWAALFMQLNMFGQHFHFIFHSCMIFQQYFKNINMIFVQCHHNICVNLTNNRLGSSMKWNLTEGGMDALFSFFKFPTNVHLRLTALIFIKGRSFITLSP